MTQHARSGARKVRAALAGGVALACLATTMTPQPAQADGDFVLLAGAGAAVVAAGVLGDYMRGNDLLAPGPDEPFRIVAGGGLNNVLGDNESDTISGLFRAEARLPWKLWRFTPFVGTEVSTRGSVYAYGGFGLDVWFGDNVVVTPNAALGYYYEGNDRDLGYPLEFRSGIEAAWQFDNGVRLGAAFHHLSNAELSDRNPGIETATINLAVPFDLLDGR